MQLTFTSSKQEYVMTSGKIVAVETHIVTTLTDHTALNPYLHITTPSNEQTALRISKILFSGYQKTP
jgi:hypothetical protein